MAAINSSFNWDVEKSDEGPHSVVNVTLNVTGNCDHGDAGGSAGGIEEAPKDGEVYGRKNGGWTPVAENQQPDPAPAFPEAPEDGLLYGRKNAAWAEVQTTGIGHNGSLDDEADLPQAGSPGDAWIVGGNIWVWDDSLPGWVDKGPLRGPQGLPGSDGQDGAAAAISVGTVTSIAPGDPARVTNVGTTSAAVFDFAIPKGDGLVISGSLDAESELPETGSTGEAWVIGGILWVWNPVTNSWQNNGNIKGMPGDKGDPGNAATVSIGSVTTGPAGSEASVVNSGTLEAAVFDITIPRGESGTPGTSVALTDSTDDMASDATSGKAATPKAVALTWQKAHGASIGAQAAYDLVLGVSGLISETPAPGAIPKADENSTLNAWVGAPFILSETPPEETARFWIRPADRVAFFHDGTAWRPLVGVYAETTAP